jgi:hypothetical protein
MIERFKKLLVNPYVRTLRMVVEIISVIVLLMIGFNLVDQPSTLMVILGILTLAITATYIVLRISRIIKKGRKNHDKKDT